MLARTCYVQCMMVGLIMLSTAAEAAVAAPAAAAVEADGAPSWPLLAVMALSMALAWRPRKDVSTNRG
ncbi:hypothetical protein HK107_05770 [Parvularcula sp. ZS-1/3]|uniref:Uncharacterized protein n=1 Tax=Parvularcula mediterranea TaxID=2732508 RepID=A0A7Y3RKM8_9PROT|nr:hypothetical protein [Parvularcula mediterranea]NNU15827.1 hypothetical protein [Parvularcula mediterranea]